MNKRTHFFNALRRLLMNPVMEPIVARLVSGAQAGSALAKIAPNHYQYPAGSVRQAVRNGITYELDISDYMEWMVYFGVVTEPRKSLYDLVSPGQTIIDAGGNIGEVAMNLALRTGATGHVYTFEPSIHCIPRLRKNLSLNSLRNITVTEAALGERSGSAGMAQPTKQNRGSLHLTSQTSAESVDVTTIDDFVRSHRIGHVDLIKIDVEGYEMNVLKGASSTIASSKPILFIEVDDSNLRNQGSSARELLHYLSMYPFLLQADTGKQVDVNHDFRNCHFDLIARF